MSEMADKLKAASRGARVRCLSRQEDALRKVKVKTEECEELTREIEDLTLNLS